MSKRSYVAKRYHNATKYSEESLKEHPQELDWSSQPTTSKEYVSQDRVLLGQYLPIQPNIFAPEEGQESGFELESWGSYKSELARLLYASNGITAFVQTAEGKHALRAAPSAGALYPIEMYVALRRAPGIADGIYNFQINTHSLILHWEGDFWQDFAQFTYGHEVIEQSDLIVIFAGVWERSAWRYKDRGYRRVLLDAGHVMGNLISYAPKEGLVPYSIAGFCDPALNSLMLLDDKKESVLAMVALPEKKDKPLRKVRQSSTYASAPAETGAGSSAHDLHLSSFLAPAVSIKEGPTSNWSAVQRLYQDKPEVKLGAGLLPWNKQIQELILQRRSARRFSGESMSGDQLGSLLKFSYDPIARAAELNRNSTTFLDPALLETYVVIHNVESINSGIYYYDPVLHVLRCLREGDFADQTCYCCLGQEMGKTAAAVVIHTCNLDKALEKYGDRAYRYMHIDAGQLGQRMNLAAIGVGVAASGLGGFFDDDNNDLLGLSLNNVIVYLTGIGMPG